MAASGGPRPMCKHSALDVCPDCNPLLRRSAILAEVCRLVIAMAKKNGLDTSRLEELLLK